MKLAYLSLTFLLLFQGFHPALAVEPQTEQALFSSRTIQFSFTLTNTTNTLLPKAKFLTYAPIGNSNSHHQLISLTCSHPYETVHDDLGNRILRFTFTNIPPFATKIITIKAELLLSHKPKSTQNQGIQRFLRPEPFIESDHPEIIHLAEKLTKENQTETADNIFRWVAQNIEYTGYASRPQGALYAARNRKGDCTEYTALFVALCRAASIPARGIGGYIAAENTVLKPADYHNWAEFYEDGVWKLADPQKKVFRKNQADYIAMRIIGELTESPMGKFSRFKAKGEGVKVVMN